MWIARIVARDSWSASRVGTAGGFALGLALGSALGSCAHATGVAASSALTVPQRSSREREPIALQRSGASAKFVCTATQLRPLPAGQLRQRHGAAVRIDDEPLVRVVNSQAVSGVAQLAWRETKLRARRPGDGDVGFEVLFADERACRPEARDEVLHERLMHVPCPN